MPDLAIERQAFEAWAKEKHLPLTRWDMNPEEYDADETIGAWSGWRARATAESTCTCPSGDGSLRWPCPAHPPEAEPKLLTDAKDAERYRWLRDASRIPHDDDGCNHIVVCSQGGEDLLWGSGMDRSIDAVIAAATQPNP